MSCPTYCCSLQTERRKGQLLPVLFIIAVLFVNGSLARGEDHILHKRASSSRQLCEHYRQPNSPLSCSFHDTCIESLYQCGSLGLSNGYSLPRCKSVRLMRASNSSCDHCLSSRSLVNWILDTETCYQSKIYNIAFDKTNSNLTTPDPQHCLSFEQQGLSALSSCYNKKHISFCNVLSQYSDDALLKSDLKKLINGLAISDYYKPLITKQFRNLIFGCGHSEVLANQVAPSPPNRVMFCVVENKPVVHEITVQNWMNEMSIELNQPLEQFTIANSLINDDNINEKCQRLSSPSAGVALRDHYRLIQWIPTVESLANNLHSFYSRSLQKYGTDAQLVFFVYEQSRHTCGNGKREAGEECDMFGENTVDGPCSEECRVELGYECDVEQLTMTSCNRTECGDGKRSSNEDCDDGNTSSGDGCSSSCSVENDYTCSQVYHQTSHCKLTPKPSSTSTIITSTHSSSTMSILPPLSSPLPTSSSSSSIIVTPTSTPPTVLGVTSSSTTRRVSFLSLILPILISACYLLLSPVLFR